MLFPLLGALSFSRLFAHYGLPLIKFIELNSIMGDCTILLASIVPAYGSIICS